MCEQYYPSGTLTNRNTCPVIRFYLDIDHMFYMPSHINTSLTSFMRKVSDI